jgi:AraC-like DNA-binding protein
VTPDVVAEAAAVALREGEPTLAWVARHLGVSARTLQRRLQDRGTSFRAVVDAVRSSEAARLRERGERAGTIAELLGFSEESALRRAFRRWRIRSSSLARPVLVSDGGDA